MPWQWFSYAKPLLREKEAKGVLDRKTFIIQESHWIITQAKESSRAKRTFLGEGDVLSTLSNTVTTGHMWLLSTWNVASETEKLNF